MKPTTQSSAHSSSPPIHGLPMFLQVFGALIGVAALVSAAIFASNSHTATAVYCGTGGLILTVLFFGIAEVLFRVRDLAQSLDAKNPLR